MKVVIQRSLNSHVLIRGQKISEIKKGMVLLVCLETDDTFDTVSRAVKKLMNMRIFADTDDKMNLNVTEAGGEILAISQFTLSWSGEKGNRPSFDRSMPPGPAEKLFDIMCDELGKLATTKKGQFGADMQVVITNDGPVTFALSF